ncbi:MAG: PIN domain-containing protein [Bacteroidales bacterium]|nr:PIN domain-containing protein [Bacteroidales bacterium]
MNKFVLDACAVLALIKGEQGMNIVKSAIESDAEVFIHSVTLLEIYYNVAKELGIDSADLFFEQIIQTKIKIIYEITESTIKSAGYMKSKYKISLGDSFVLATAKWHKAKVISSDHHELDVIETSENIDFLWIR